MFNLWITEHLLSKYGKRINKFCHNYIICLGYFIYNFSHSNWYISQCYFILHFPDVMQSIISNVLSIFTGLFVFLQCVCVYMTRTLNTVQFISVQSSHSVVSDCLWPHELQHTRPPCSSSTLGVYSNSCLMSRWWHLIISPSVVPFPPAFNLSQHQGLFQWVNFSHQVAKVLEFQLQHQSFQWIFRTDRL